MILHIYTIIHTLMSFVAIFTGFVVLFGLFAGQRLDGSPVNASTVGRSGS